MSSGKENVVTAPELQTENNLTSKNHDCEPSPVEGLAMESEYSKDQEQIKNSNLNDTTQQLVFIENRVDTVTMNLECSEGIRLEDSTVVEKQNVNVVKLHKEDSTPIDNVSQVRPLNAATTELENTEGIRLENSTVIEKQNVNVVKLHKEDSNPMDSVSQVRPCEETLNATTTELENTEVVILPEDTVVVEDREDVTSAVKCHAEPDNPKDIIQELNPAGSTVAPETMESESSELVIQSEDTVIVEDQKDITSAVKCHAKIDDPEDVIQELNPVENTVALVTMESESSEDPVLENSATIIADGDVSSLGTLALAYASSDSETEETESVPSAQQKDFEICAVGSEIVKEYRITKEVEVLSEDSEDDSDSSSSDDSDSDSSEDTSSDSSDSDSSDSVEARSQASKTKSQPRKKTKGELDDLPPIEELKISMPEVLCDPLGEVSWTVEQMVVVRPTAGKPTLNLDSILFVERGRRVLGRVFDVFGQVSEPHYCVRFNSAEHIKESGIVVGMAVYYCPNTPHTSLVFMHELVKMKGFDTVGEDEPPEFSDDEEERAYNQMQKQKQRHKVDEQHNNQLPKNTDVPFKRRRMGWQSNNPWSSTWTSQGYNNPQGQQGPRGWGPANPHHDTQNAYNSQNLWAPPTSMSTPPPPLPSPFKQPGNQYGEQNAFNSCPTAPGSFEPVQYGFAFESRANAPAPACNPYGQPNAYDANQYQYNTQNNHMYQQDNNNPIPSPRMEPPSSFRPSFGSFGQFRPNRFPVGIPRMNMQWSQRPPPPPGMGISRPSVPWPPGAPPPPPYV